MSFKTIKGNIKETLNAFQVSGKSIQYHSAEFGHSAPPPSGHTATGGIINDYSDGGTVYRTHIFTSTGTFDVTALGTFGNTVDFLVVGGGGGGGGSYPLNPSGVPGGGVGGPYAGAGDGQGPDPAPGGTSALANSGSGGGGGKASASNPNGRNGGDGGSGIVILAYPT